MSSLQQLHAYALQPHTCRPSVLLHYFGETLQHPCQTCDVCMAGVKGWEWHDVTSEVLEALKAAALGAERSQVWGSARCKRQNAAPAAAAAAAATAAAAAAAAGQVLHANSAASHLTAGVVNPGSGSGEGARSYLFWRGGFVHLARMSHVTRHASRVTRHTLHVTRHTSHVTPRPRPQPCCPWPPPAASPLFLSLAARRHWQHFNSLWHCSTLFPCPPAPSRPCPSSSNFRAQFFAATTEHSRGRGWAG
jgi:hypothetical protein